MEGKEQLDDCGFCSRGQRVRVGNVLQHGAVRVDGVSDVRQHVAGFSMQRTARVQLWVHVNFFVLRVFLREMSVASGLSAEPEILAVLCNALLCTMGNGSPQVRSDGTLFLADRNVPGSVHFLPDTYELFRLPRHWSSRCLLRCCHAGKILIRHTPIPVPPEHLCR